MPEPEKVDASSQPCATGTQQKSYKCLLYQQVQKLKKQLPVYQTYNEGSLHQPKFRTTVWVDGGSYTSPNTFQNRKLAELDASKITLFGIMNKLKNEAKQHVLEDKFFCKSILVEYAVRMNIPRPTYQTTESGSFVRIFRSSLVLNDVSYTGDECRTKKEAEQSAARAVILKYLDSETGIILSEIIKIKFDQLTKDTQIAQNDTNVVNEAKGDEGTKTPYTEPLQATSTHAMNLSVDITQTHTPQIPTQTLAPVLTQTPSAKTNNALSMNPPVHVNQMHVPQISTQTHTQTTPVPTVQTPFVGTSSAPTCSAPCVGHFANILATPYSTHIPEISIQPPTQTYTMPTVMAQTPTQAPTPSVLAQTPISETNNAPVSTSPSLGHFDSTPATHPSNNVVQPIDSRSLAPLVTVASSLPTSSPTTGKKRNRKSKKNAAQKRMRDENKLAMSAMFYKQVPTFSAQ